MPPAPPSSRTRYATTPASPGTIPRPDRRFSGIAAQDLFLWFPVLAIRLDDNASGIIHFDVSVVDKRLPLSLFEVPPDCTPVSSSGKVRPQQQQLYNYCFLYCNSIQNPIFFIAQSQLDKIQNKLDQDLDPKAAF
ncbi:hypothetical protein Cni_G01865 [Canna indica]|uniref:Uncharacterized protein n=1 Tax=Canna indica TaxID=4628 RepID=A0AAQ3Q264_9LILI|nr:hypothetical protein Cni_G01865 [Canna indica]